MESIQLQITNNQQPFKSSSAHRRRCQRPSNRIRGLRHVAASLSESVVPRFWVWLTFSRGHVISFVNIALVFTVELVYYCHAFLTCNTHFNDEMKRFTTIYREHFISIWSTLSEGTSTLIWSKLSEGTSTLIVGCSLSVLCLYELWWWGSERRWWWSRWLCFDNVDNDFMMTASMFMMLTTEMILR